MKRVFLISLLSLGHWFMALPQTPNEKDSVNESHILNEVIVKANESPYRISKGGLVTKVAGTTLGDVGTGFDVLSQVPGVRTDESSVEVIGKGSPTIYINGRRLFDISELQRLSSKDIQNVEVLTNPGAKYGAEVKAVILIKTIKKQGDGLSGSLQATERLAHYFSQSDNLTLNYRTGGLDVFGSLNFDYARLFQEQRNSTSIVTKDVYYLIDSDLLILPAGTNVTGNIGINWQINPNHSLGAKYESSVTPYSKSHWQVQENISENGTLSEYIDRDTRWRRKRHPTNSLNLYYLGKINSLTINITNDFFSQESNNLQTISETSSVNDRTTISTANRVSSRLWASKGTGTYNFGGNEIEFGYEFTSTHRKDIFLNDSDELPDANDRIKESNIAGFVSINIPYKRVEFYAGARYEYVMSDYYMFGDFVPGQSRKYHRLYPDFDFTFPINKAKFTLSYATKTKRPLYSQLSNAIQYDDRFTYETGNPLLTSEMIHSLSLAGVWRWLYFSAGWDYDRDAIISVIRPYKDGSPISLMTYANVSHISKYSVVLSLSPRIRRWSPRFRLNLLGQDFAIPTIEGREKMNAPLLFWNLYNTISLGNGFNLNADLTGRTRGDMDVVTLRSSWQLNLSVTKNFNGWFFQFQATDIFRTARNSMITRGEQMSLNKWNYSDTRTVRFIMRYSFNTAMSKYKGKSAGMTERNRLL